MIRFSRRRLVSGSVVAVGAVAVASSSFADRAGTVHLTKSALLFTLAPPTPRARTLGVTRAASLVSYCWSRPTSGGRGTGVCADGALGHPAHTLYWRPRARVTLNLRLPASDVRVQVARVSRFAQPLHNTIGLKPRREDSRGRMWTVRIPRTASRATDMLISARFSQGDIYAELGLRLK